MVRDMDQSTSSDNSDNLCGENTFLSHVQQFSKGRKPFKIFH